MKSLLIITGLSLGCAGWVITSNASSLKEEKLAHQQETNLKDQKITDLNNSLAKMKIENAIVIPLQTANNRSNLQTFSRTYTLPKTYHIDQIPSESKNEVKFTLYQKEAYRLYEFTESEQKKDPGSKICDIKYDIDTEQITAWDDNQWQKLSEHTFLKHALLNTSLEQKFN